MQRQTCSAGPKSWATTALLAAACAGLAAALATGAGSAKVGGFARGGDGLTAFGPVRVGMGRGEAIEAAGPTGFVTPLCGQPDGLVFEAKGGTVSRRSDGALTVMAMFAEGRVSEMDASLDPLSGSRLAEPECFEVYRAEVARLRAHYGEPAVADANEDTSAVKGRLTSLSWPGWRAIQVLTRWYSGGAGCFVRGGAKVRHGAAALCGRVAA